MEQIQIKGTDSYQRIYVSTSGHSVWISAMVRGGGAYMGLSVDEAKKMIDALQQAIQKVNQDAHDFAFDAREEARLDAMYDAKYGDE